MKENCASPKRQNWVFYLTIDEQLTMGFSCWLVICLIYQIEEYFCALIFISMQFHLEKYEDLTAVLKISLATDDYAKNVERQIQKVRKTIQMPGFRKGNVPAGLIQKQYGGILIEEVNKLGKESMDISRSSS